MSPGGVIREGEAGHSLPGRSGRCRAEGSGQGVLMSASGHLEVGAPISAPEPGLPGRIAASIKDTV